MSLRRDLRYAIRSLLAAPGFALAALASIAIGIGANTTIFSVAAALLLEPLPYGDPARLVILWNRSPGLGITEDWFSTAQYFDIRNGHRGFEQLAIAIGGNFNLTGDGEPERVGVIRVSSNLLPMLGARAEAGRLFGPEHDRPGTSGAAVLSHGTWMRRYGGSPSAIGRVLTLNGQPCEIIGVLPAAFSIPREVLPTLGGAETSEILLPLPLAADAARIRNREDYNLIGRLRPDVTLAQAQQEMDGITARLREQHPEIYPPNGGLTFSIVPLQDQVVGGARRSVLVLSAAVGLVLLIACANVANLLLSRALARQREIAVRSALGARPSQIVRQLLTESVALGLAGGGCGLWLAWWSLAGIRALGAASVPRLQEIAIDGRVLLFTVAVSVCSGIAFGLAPALRLGRYDLTSALKDAARGGAASGAVWGKGRHLRRLFVVVQLALSVMLLIGAGLLVRSFARLQGVQPGFDPSQVLTFELALSGRQYADAEVALQTYRRLWERLGAVPGVVSAGGISSPPLSGAMAWGPITVEDHPPAPGEPFVNVDIRSVGGEYFEAMRIPLLRGRLFTAADTRSSPRVILVDERMANQLWPNQDPIGRRVRTGGMDASADAPWMTVVGVVGRVKQDRLDSDPRMAMYWAHAQVATRTMTIALRAATDAQAMAADVRAAVRDIDPDLPVYKVRTMDDRVSESLAARRFSTLLLTVFAIAALALATVGIYGVMAGLVSQGVRELGIRMALGATPREIRALVVRQGLALVVAGLAIGLGGALVLTRFMRGLLFAVTPSDPATFAAIALVLGVTALLAAYVPARRAARLDLIESLRAE
jgi:predicted permease